MNYAVFDGKVIPGGIGHQYNRDVRGGDGRMGSGYGNHVIIRSEDPNRPGTFFDALYAHFPDGALLVKNGDIVKAGQQLGRMATAEEFANPVTRKRVGSGTGPHTSLDFFPVGGPYVKKNPYPYYRALHPLIDPMALPNLLRSEGGLTEFQKRHYRGNKDGGSITGVTKTHTGLNQSMDSTGSKVVYIVQPLVKRGRDTVVVKHIDRPIPVSVPNSGSIPKPSLA